MGEHHPFRFPSRPARIDQRCDRALIERRDARLKLRLGVDSDREELFEADQALVLRTIMLEKRTNEYRLRKRFGPAFNPRYAEALLRLLGVGLIQRHLDGWLEIDEVAVNSITRQLRAKQYIS